jgi:hypothetical protein
MRMSAATQITQIKIQIKPRVQISVERNIESD